MTLPHRVRQLKTHQFLAAALNFPFSDCVE